MLIGRFDILKHKLTLSISLLFLTLALFGCAATPQKPETPETIPQQFLGYWVPAQPLSNVGLHIHTDGRINGVDNTKGDLLDANLYKFIHSPDPNTMYAMVRSVKYPSYIAYYKYKTDSFDYLDISCTILDETSGYLVDIKDWNNFNQAKETKKAKDMFKDKWFGTTHRDGYQRCSYSKPRSS